MCLDVFFEVTWEIGQVEFSKETKGQRNTMVVSFDPKKIQVLRFFHRRSRQTAGRFGEEHVKDITDKNSSTIDKYGWLHSGDKALNFSFLCLAGGMGGRGECLKCF